MSIKKKHFCVGSFEKKKLCLEIKAQQNNHTAQGGISAERQR